MRTIKVINKGKRIRERLGSRFLPNQEHTLEVNSREYLTLKAVKDFEIQIMDSNNSNNASNSDSTSNKTNNGHDDSNTNSDRNNSDDAVESELNYHDLNVEQVLEAIENGSFSADEAIAKEVAGKNRVTLLNKLEEIKQEA